MYSARRGVFEGWELSVDSHVPDLGESVGEALLRPHRSYLPVMRPLLGSGRVKGMAHITGGGITDNLPRVLPEGLAARVDRRAWRTPPIFRWLGEAGSVPEMDLRRAFNMGIGLILVVAPGDLAPVQAALLDAGEANPVVIGEVEAGAGGSDTRERPPRRAHLGPRLEPAGDPRCRRRRPARRDDRDCRVQSSGRGRPQPCRGGRRADGGAAASRLRVARGLRRRLSSGCGPSGWSWCASPASRRLSPVFVDAFPNAVLNVHPSLLPAFPGLEAPAQAVAHGSRSPAAPSTW